MENAEDTKLLPKAPAKPKKHAKSKKNRLTKPKAKKRKTAKPEKKQAAVRSERLDMRLTRAEKAKIGAKAKKTRRTVTSLIIEAIEKIR